VPGGGRCALHPRPSARARGYTPAWAPYARAWLARFPYCGQRQDGRFYPDQSWCTRRGQRVEADVVDHIRSLAVGGALLDPSNHQSLCHACNNRKR
jgi:hypothetical protein